MAARGMEEPVDRAAMIESASRSLRQQMARAGNAGPTARPRSKGSMHGVQRGQSLTGIGSRGNQGCPSAGEQQCRGENAQRRIRSAENQHRQVSAVPREGPHLNQAVWHANSATPQFAGGSAGAAVTGIGGDAAESDLEASLEALVSGAAAGAAAPGGVPVDQEAPAVIEFTQEMKRPASRKKDPSASAAVGLGNLSGPACFSDAFSEAQRKTRQPIPVESWGPRPPSRAGVGVGVQQKSGPLDAGLDAHVDPKIVLSRSHGGTSSKGAKAVQVEQVSALGGTWAAARGGSSEARRGRERKSAGRGPGETHDQVDLGIFGSGKFRDPKAAARQAAVPYPGALAVGCGDGLQGALEVSGYHIGDRPSSPPNAALGPRPSSPSQCGSPPSRNAGPKRGSLTTVNMAEAVSVEDVEAPSDSDLGPAPHPAVSGHRAGPAPQVIVNRPIVGQGLQQDGRSRGPTRRTSDPRAPRGRQMPFSTALDADFLSLFAS